MRTRLQLIVFVLFLVSITSAQIPQKLNYQGIITDDSGNPLTGSQTLTLRLYDVVSGGTALWEETQNVNVELGVFNVMLGEVTPLNLPFDEQYWLGITVAPNATELSPRIQLAAAAYSFNSLSVSDTSISPWQTSGGNLYYNEGPVFIGRTDPISGSSNEYFGIRATTAANEYGGMYVETSDATGWPYYGYATNNTFRAWHYYQPSDSSWRLNNLETGIIVKGDGRLGFRTSIPSENFVIVHDQFVNGNSPGSYGGFTLLQTSNLNRWKFYVSQSSSTLRLFYNNTSMGEFNNTNGNYTAVSDLRLKKNINPMPAMLSVVDKLQPVTYQLTHYNGQKLSYGLIAQEVETVLPDIVNTINGDDGDGIQNLKTVSYTELVPVLIKAMQEQQTMIEELQKKVEDLSRRVN